jgi:hypothetical protein
MAVRQPLYNNSGNQIQEMTTAMVDEIVDQIVYQYSLNPSVTLSVVGSGGSLRRNERYKITGRCSFNKYNCFP